MLCQVEDDLPLGQFLGTSVCNHEGNPGEQQDKNRREGDHHLHGWEETNKGDIKEIWAHSCLRGILEGTCTARPVTQLPA